MARPAKVFVPVVAAALAACGAGDEWGFRSGSPADALPPNVSRVLPAGLRPDWSADSRRLLFLDDLVGDG